MFAENKSDLSRKLKELEGKAIFKLTRIESLNDGEFLRILHKVKSKNIIFIGNDMKEWVIEIPKAKELEILKNGFKIKNCTYELLEVK
jgi:hypothetical protein